MRMTWPMQTYSSVPMIACPSARLMIYAAMMTVLKMSATAAI